MCKLLPCVCVCVCVCISQSSPFRCISAGPYIYINHALYKQHSRKKNKGIAIELMHYLGDGLYQTDEI
jgi:hypothetical protein